MFLKNYFFSELSRMCFTVQLSRFLSVFDSSDILSYRFALVKNFFNFFIFLDCHSFATALLFYHVLSCLSSTFLSHFLKVSAINLFCSSSQYWRTAWNFHIIARSRVSVNPFFTYFFNFRNASVTSPRFPFPVLPHTVSRRKSSPQVSAGSPLWRIRFSYRLLE